MTEELKITDGRIEVLRVDETFTEDELDEKIAYHQAEITRLQGYKNELRKAE